MFGKIIEQIKFPVTSTINRSKEETIKKGLIKLSILSAIFAIINVINTLSSIFSKYSSKGWYSYLDKDVLKERRWEAIKDAGLIGAFFKTVLIIAVVIGVVAFLLWVISKIVKCKKEYSETLSMTNSFMTIIAAGSILNLIISLIFAPLGLILMFMISIYAGYTLIYAYRDSLEIENADKLVIVTTGVFTVILVIVIILLCAIIGVSLKNISAITDLIKLF